MSDEATEEWKSRMKQEYVNLRIKENRLSEFVCGDCYEGGITQEQLGYPISLLTEQLSAMRRYIDILEWRNAFDKAWDVDDVEREISDALDE